MNPSHRITVLRMLIRNAEQLKTHLAEWLIAAASGPATEYARIYTRYAAAAHKLAAYRAELALLQPPAATLQPTA